MDVRKSLLLAVACLLLAAPAFASTWDAAAEFSLTTNPLGVWSYGFSDTLGGTMTLFNNLDYAILPGGGVAWDMSPEPNAWSGFVCKNLNPTATSWYGLEIPAGGVAFHPGFVGVENGLPAKPFLPNIVRWTSPVAGQVSVAYGFASPLDGIGVHVLQNGSELFSGLISNSSFSGTLLCNVAIGDTIDFVASCPGDDCRAKFVNVSGTITTVPEPSALVATFSGLVGIGGLVLRRRRG